MPERYEHILFRYSSALERGDFEMVADVLREAERDPALEAMLLELNEVYAAEQTGRSNHKNPKELAMVAPLYEKRAPERVRTYNLPMVAALAVVALLGVLVATRIAPPTQWNTAQNGSPEPNVLQGVPDECAPSEADPGRIQLYARPSTESRYAYDAFSTLYISQNNISQLDAVETEGQTWYFVRISGVFRGDMQGWMTAEEYNRNVRCAPLVNPMILAQVTSTTTLTATPSPTLDMMLLATATALIAEASAMPPTVVPPDTLAVMTATPMPFDGTMPTFVPRDVQGLTTFTPTPAPFDGTMPPTISVPEPLAVVPTVVPFVPTTVPEVNLSIPAYPLYMVQEGDTLLSILSHFNLSAPWLDQLIFINDLPDETAELPETLLIPVPSGRQLLTCVVDEGEAVDMRIDPASDASSILALPAGEVFQVIDEVETADGTWYMAAWQAGGAPLRSGWVDVEAISQRSDCRRFSASFETSYSLPIFDPAAYPYGIEACFVVTANAITGYFPPELDADIVNEIPAGTQLQVIALELNEAGLWYSVLYYRHVNPVGSQYMSYVPVEALELPDSCNADEVIAAAEAEATSPAPTVIPARGNFYGGFTNCAAITNRLTLVTLGSTRNSELLTELPAGMQLEVTGGTEQSDGMWYLLNYVTEYGTVMSGFVSGEDVTVAGDCPLISVPLELTAAPMPTALPPSATPTPAR